MQESYVQVQREKSELTEQVKVMEDRLKKLRLETEENERNFKADLRERECENKLLAATISEHESINQTQDEDTRRMHVTMRSHLERLRSDLDTSKLLNSSLLDESDHEEPGTPDSSTHSAYDRSILSRSLKDDKPQDVALLDDFASEIERIKSAMRSAEALNAQVFPYIVQTSRRIQMSVARRRIGIQTEQTVNLLDYHYAW